MTHTIAPTETGRATAFVRKLESDARRSLEANISDHRLTVILDQNGYRHLRMAKPGSSAYAWDVVTWPGHLSITGDIADGYTFARTHDMLDFFRPRPEPYRIDQHYWGQKVAHAQRDSITRFEPELFIAAVQDEIADLDPVDFAWCRQKLQDEVPYALRRASLYDHITEHDAYRFVEEWTFADDDGNTHRLDPEAELVASGRVHTFDFLMSLHAIVTTVEAYWNHRLAEADRDQATIEAIVDDIKRNKYR